MKKMTQLPIMLLMFLWSTYAFWDLCIARHQGNQLV